MYFPADSVFKNTGMEARLIRSIRLNGEIHPIGSIIESDPQSLEALRQRGFVEIIPEEPKPLVNPEKHQEGEFPPLDLDPFQMPEDELPEPAPAETAAVVSPENTSKPKSSKKKK